MEDIQKNNELQQELLTYCKYLRLTEDVEIDCKNIADTQTTHYEGMGFGEKMKNFGKTFKKNLFSYDNKYKSSKNNLDDFESKYYNSVITDSKAHSNVYELFKDDTYGLNKILLGSSIILDNEYNFNHVDEGLTAVSSKIYNDGNYLLELRNRLKTNYKKICPNTLTSAQKGLLFGTAVASLATACFLPVVLAGGVGASAAVTTGALAAHGFADMQIGLAVMTAESLAMSALLVGTVYGGMKLYNDVKIKNSFKKLTPEQHAFYLAIQCTYLQYAKENVSLQTFKDQLDEVLKTTESLKSDLDFFYFVEKEDGINNSKKMDIFHNFDDRLKTILDI